MFLPFDRSFEHWLAISEVDNRPKAGYSLYLVTRALVDGTTASDAGR